MKTVSHYLLIRSSYGNQWGSDANERRLAITRGITVATLAAQTCREFEVAVLVDPQDELMHERLGVFGEAGVKVTAIANTGPTDGTAANVAYHGYRFDWAGALGLVASPTLLTRLDDDDGLHPTTVERIQRAAAGLKGRTALIHPVGYRVWKGRYSRVTHPCNAMHTLFTPEGDSAHVYDYGHVKVRKQNWHDGERLRLAPGPMKFPVIDIDREPAWLWVRHDDALSGHKIAERAIDDRLRREFPVDWSLVR